MQTFIPNFTLGVEDVSKSQADLFIRRLCIIDCEYHDHKNHAMCTGIAYLSKM